MKGVPLPEFIIYIRFQLIPNPLETWRLSSSSCSSSFCFFQEFPCPRTFTLNLPPSHIQHHGNQVVFSDACFSFLGALTLLSLSYMIMKVVFKIILTQKRRITHEHKYQAPYIPTSLLSQWGIALPPPFTFSGDNLNFIVHFPSN